MNRDLVASRTLRLSFQVFRRGLFMPIWNLEEIVRRRLMRDLFVHLRKERVSPTSKRVSP